jgi:lipoprotein-anchoring transpeptidase ErfK/SrfK
VKRLVFPALFAAGFVAAGVSAGVVVADATTTAATTTGPATTSATTTTTTQTVATTTTTATTPVHRAVIPAGVRVAGVKVGGLAPADAVAAVQAAFDRPLQIVVNRTRLTLTPRDYASAWVPTAVARARAAAPGTNQHLVVNVQGGPLRAWVKQLAKRFSRPAVDATFAFRAGRPRVTKEQTGRRLDAHALTARVIAALQSNSRLPIRVHTRAVQPAVTAKSIGPDIVINRAMNTLTLYDGARFVRAFRVATGQAIYPTPKGIFHIVVKWVNPWWYPPTQDAWARGLMPVPPGPDNPLGTRWMGLSVPGIGIHGTDEPSSIGYSASHGCIRMEVPDAEWLFERVDIGTPVDII